MTDSQSMLGDIPVGNWIDRHVPAPIRPYLRLMRLDRPIGTWLLLFPCWWSIALAADGPLPHLGLMVLFAIGSLIMRGAGCTINDLADHEFDAQVARTAARPIPSGAVTPKQAMLFLALQLLVGLGILLMLNRAAVILGCLSLFLVVPYPFMKRITWWPQAWLGLTFNWGALMGWAAVTGSIDWAPVILYAAGPLWTLGYDTIYAHQDKEDDVMVGVKSTALRLGDATPRWIAGFYAGTLVLIALAGYLAHEGIGFFILLFAAAAHMTWQVRGLKLDDSADCLHKFKSNRWIGWIILAAIIAGKIV